MRRMTTSKKAPDVAERLKAAREGRRHSEEIRMAPALDKGGKLRLASG